MPLPLPLAEIKPVLCLLYFTCAGFRIEYKTFSSDFGKPNNEEQDSAN